MAFSSLKQCRSVLYTPVRGLAVSATSRAASSAATATMQQEGAKTTDLMATYGPIGVLGAMVGFALLIGAHTAKQQLLHSPSVQVTKTRRETVPEVEIPDATLRSSDKFLDKSFLRKVGNIQERKHNVPYRPEPYVRKAETLKSVGVNK